MHLIEFAPRGTEGDRTDGRGGATAITAPRPQPRHARPAAPTRRAGHRPDIEGLRAVAILLVVAYHAGVAAVPGGYVGVDVFFVLSGFLITGLIMGELTRTGHISFSGFYARRIRRLLPASLLTLLVTTLVFTVALSPLDRPQLGDDVRAAALYVANWHFAAAALDYLRGGGTSPVLHFWSLAVEEQFYVVWPVLLVLVAGRAARRGDTEGARRLAAIALATLAAVSLVLSARSGAQPYAYYGLHTRAWELAAGGLLALAPVGLLGRRAPVRALVGWTGAGLVLLSALTYDERTTFPGVAAVVPVLGTVLVVAAGRTSQDSGLPLVLSAAPLRYLGRISYSWYLWHWPALALAGVLVGTSGTEEQAAGDASLPLTPALLAVLASVAIAAVSHAYVEDPVRRSAWLAGVRARSLALGAGATAVAALVPMAIVSLAGSGDDVRGGTTTVVAPAAGKVQSAPAPRGDSATPTPTPTPTPVTLTMTPQEARDDIPTGNERCYAGYGTASTLPASRCLFGDPNGTRSVVLLGDSHAQQWFPALDAQAKKNHWRLYVWVKSECPFIDLAIWLPQFHGEYPTCAPWRENVLRRIGSLGRVDAVLLAHTSTYHVHLLDDGKQADNDDALTLWADGFRGLLRKLEPLATNVLVMHDPPKPSRDVPACLAEHPSDANSCAIDRDEAFLWTDRLLEAEIDGGLQRDDVIDLVPYMCLPDVCPVVSADGLIMYRDHNHLTVTYTKTLADRLGEQLAARLS